MNEAGGSGAPDDGTERRGAAEIDRLYWESSASVGEIADRLGLSRRALYDALTPLSAGARCPVCGGELVYANRSQRDAGRAVCKACGREHEVPAVRAATTPKPGPAVRPEAERAETERGAAARGASAAMERERSRAATVEPESESEIELEPALDLEPEPELEQAWDAGARAPIDAEPAPRRGRLLLIGGAALLGAAAGAAVGLWWRRQG